MPNINSKYIHNFLLYQFLLNISHQQKIFQARSSFKELHSTQPFNSKQIYRFNESKSISAKNWAKITTQNSFYMTEVYICQEKL
jgi:hypothetical protein